MTDSNPDLAFDAFRDDLVAYLARRLGVSHAVALATLGNWLVTFEPVRASVYALEGRNRLK